jgi:hypothetical protein
LLVASYHGFGDAITVLLEAGAGVNWAAAVRSSLA